MLPTITTIGSNMNWVYEGQDYTDKHDESLYGFVYRVTFESGSGELYSYYGKKKMLSETTVVGTVSGEPRKGSIEQVRKLKPMTAIELENRTKAQVSNNTRNKLVVYDVVHKDNDWRTYTGSCKDTKDYIPIHKEIFCFAKTQRELTYLEAKTLFTCNALEDDKCLNGNILSRFYRGNLV